MTGAAGLAAVSGTCELIWVDGPDAEGFLQGLLTNDVAALPDGGSCPALLLDSRGHVRCDMRVVRAAREAFTLVTTEGQGAELVRLLEEYHFSEDADILGPEPFAMATFLGETGGPVPGADLMLPGRVPGTTEAIGADASAMIAAGGATEAPERELEARRIAAGVPRFGVDFDARTLVQEAGLESTAISFDKGCYLGQETVARIHYRGQVNRRLVGVLLQEPAGAGAAITSGGKRVGTLTSVARIDAGPAGLAILRREVAPGDRVEVGGAGQPATVVALPFTEPSQSAG